MLPDNHSYILGISGTFAFIRQFLANRRILECILTFTDDLNPYCIDVRKNGA